MVDLVSATEENAKSMAEQLVDLHPVELASNQRALTEQPYSGGRNSFEAIHCAM
ncbi:hypothetical protein [Bradyrhizobium arachidis]|uniref:hypothetical protein n=1 Tax=Bradyrhizobium arachidis TaxID=858423 RepID=UPI0021615E65|nr:hypothetical protein [Bradyrhizobium arachidis]UVO27050.1 hypothetical protein KUF59_31630 [Bradyrhizobium arachidis]